MLKYLTIIIVFIIFTGCNSNSPVDPAINNTNSNYVKVNTIEQGSSKFEQYSASGSILNYGYNDIGFKVFISGVEKKSGVVYYQPKMFHFIGSPWLSFPGIG